jgi:hypothetical protein
MSPAAGIRIALAREAAIVVRTIHRLEKS